jgi:hypothetical protein
MSGLFGYGARPSPKAHLALTKSAAAHPLVAPRLALIGSLLAANGGALPAPQTGNHPINTFPPVEDQSITESCTAHAASVILGRKLPFIPSPLYFYSCAGALARADAVPIGKPPALQDNGRYLSYMVAAVMKCGVVPMGPLAPDGRNSDVTPENATDEPEIEELEAGVTECLSGAHTVDLSAADALHQCAAALDAGIALYIGFDCGATFQGLSRRDIAQPTPANDSNQGGHALAVGSYRINAAGEYEFLVRNSWSERWPSEVDLPLPSDAPPGCVWCSSAWLLACWEIWLMDETLIHQSV